MPWTAYFPTPIALLPPQELEILMGQLLRWQQMSPPSPLGLGIRSVGEGKVSIIRESVSPFLQKP